MVTMRNRGFTLIEVLVTLSIVAMIMTIAAPRYFGNIDRAREDVLREDLFVLRDGIDKFYSDKNRYPNTLEELVTEKYLRSIPVDPFTKSRDTWQIVPADDPSLGAIVDVHSGTAERGRDGTFVREW